MENCLLWAISRKYGKSGNDIQDSYEIMEFFKRVISGFSGLLYGFLGIRWLILSIAFMIPDPDCGPGTKDWSEYTGVGLPMGIVMLIVFIITSVCIFYYLRNKKTYCKQFCITTVLGALMSVETMFMGFGILRTIYHWGNGVAG